ncbi:MAG: TVP38/TMEM64 family protein [Spirochaetota bacterium]
MKSRTRVILLLVPAVVLVAAGYFLEVPRYLRQLLDWIDSIGAVGPIVFIVLYILVTVLLVPGSILTLGAGALFGVLWGTVYVSVGSTLGATAAFLVGRFFMRDWVAAKIARSERFSAVDEAIGREGGKIVFLLRLSPIFPYNFSNYAFALTKVGVGSYMLASWVGMIPGTIMYVYIGSLIESLAALGTGGRARTTAEWILYGVGLVATVTVTIFVTRLARRAIQERVGEEAVEAEGN